MKILFVTCQYPSKKYPIAGAGAFHNPAKALQKKDVDIAVLEIDMRSIRRRRKLGFYEDVFDGIKVYRTAFPCGPIPIIMPLLFKLFAAYAFRKIIAQGNRPDIIHAHFGDTSSYVAFLKKKHSIPLIVTEHSSAVLKENRNKGIERTYKNAYDKADALIAVSKALKENMRILTNKEILVIPNIIPSYHYLKRVEKNTDFTFISVGGLIESKRFDITIKAFSIINKENPNTRLIIAGDGALKGKLKQLTKDNGVEERVEFLSIVPNAMLPDIYNSCHCFVLPSMYETFGVAYAEALACGLPVIATKCGGPEDFVDESNGVLIPVGDLEATVEAMKYIYDNYSSYDCEGISREILLRLSEESVGKSICDVYSSVLGREAAEHKTDC